MKKTLGILTIVLCLVITNMASVFALDQPEKPDTINNETITEYNQQVDEYNNYVDTYNAKVDNDYEEAYSAYEEEKANVEANNQFVDNVEAKVNADSSEARGFTNNSTNELPTDWNDETSEESLKTIQIEKSSNPSGQKVKVINVHVYLDDSDIYTPEYLYELIERDKFKLSDEISERAVLTEWETAEIDYDDTVTISNEASQFAGNIVWLNGTRKWFGANPLPYFFRDIEGYTQGYWTLGSSMLSETATEVEYGWNAGENYTVHYAEQPAISRYSENGQIKTEEITVRTTDKQEPKNIFALFTYLFTRLSAEPEKQALPEEPTKGEYLDKLDHLDLIDEITPADDTVVEPKAKKSNATTSVIVPTISTTAIEQSPKSTIINAASMPKAAPIGSWALINLILTVIAGIIAIVSVSKKKDKPDDEPYSEEDKHDIKNLFKYKLFSLLVALGAIIVFILTEDITLPMGYVDDWTLIMVLFPVVEIFNVYFINKIANYDNNKEN